MVTPRAYGNVKIHRVAFEHYNGYLPNVVRHSCDNVWCLSKDHLVAGTKTDNIRDRVIRGRSANHVSKEEAETVKGLRSLGLKYKQIANQLNIKVKRVAYVLTRKEGE